MTAPELLDSAPPGGAPPRHEFRHFGASLGAVRGRLRALADDPPGEAEEREDVYFVARGQIGAILKFRKAALDLKILRGRSGVLEQWEPASRMRFPMSTRVLEEDFLMPAALFLPPFPGPSVSAEAFLAVVGETPGIRAVSVVKRRERLRIGGAQGEYARIEIVGRTLETVAIEGDNPVEVEHLVAEAGLSGANNVSYQRFLHAVSFE